MPLSIDESIQRLKAEIIAQDWSLSIKRIELLADSFTCLSNRFKNRKAAKAILTMAVSVLAFIKRKGDDSPAVSIDFLKECMAHIVSLYESDDFDPEKEEEVFKGVYHRFNLLKKQINNQSDPDSLPVETEQPGQDTAISNDLIEDPLLLDGIDQLKERVIALHKDPDDNVNYSEVEQLVRDLQMSLSRAESVGDTIKHLVNELMTMKEAVEKQVSSVKSNLAQEDLTLNLQKTTTKPSVKSCPPTPVRHLVLQDSSIYIQEKTIAMVREIPASRCQAYLQQSCVPLSDFKRPFRSLSRIFQGPLASLSNRSLKKIIIPLVIPRGKDLPETPDLNGNKLVILSNDHWHGAIICSAVGDKPVIMNKFKKDKNGDMVGSGFSETGQLLPVVNIIPVLKREGFLTMVEK